MNKQAISFKEAVKLQVLNYNFLFLTYIDLPSEEFLLSQSFKNRHLNFLTIYLFPYIVIVLYNGLCIIIKLATKDLSYFAIFCLIYGSERPPTTRLPPNWDFASLILSSCYTLEKFLLYSITTMEFLNYTFILFIK